MLEGEMGTGRSGQHFAGPELGVKGVRVRRRTWDNATLVPLDWEKREVGRRTWDNATLVPLRLGEA